MAWYTDVRTRLQNSELFIGVELVGGKVRATVDANRFLDIHFDPTTHSYSYALIDLSLPYPGDKRLFGWDDFTHPGDPDLSHLSSHPHHFQERTADGKWRFMPSEFRGNIEVEIETVIDRVRQFLGKSTAEETPDTTQ
ncbi:MAG: hypothetical protein HY023_06360 [Chloroflexi bacterium]|nr:hypothetical protein [Chloroflexota bacterium]